MRARLVPAAFLVLVAASPLTAEQAAPSLVGCYTLELGEWSQPFPPTWPEAFRHPQTFRLHAEDGPVRKVTPELPTRDDELGRDSWRSLGNGRLLIAWSNGVRHLWLSVQAAPDATLHGTASAFLDSTLARPHPRAAAIARPIPCAAAKL